MLPFHESDKAINLKFSKKSSKIDNHKNFHNHELLCRMYISSNVPYQTRSRNCVSVFQEVAQLMVHRCNKTYQRVQDAQAPKLRRTKDCWLLFRFHDQLMRKLGKPKDYFRFLLFCMDVTWHVFQLIIYLQKTYRSAWAMKLLTTRPSSIFMRGPYVLNILAMRISVEKQTVLREWKPL